MPCSDRIALEKERAWREHDPLQGRIPAPVRQRLAVLKRGLAEAARQIERHLFDNGGPSELVCDCVRRRGLARQRAVKDLSRSDRLPGAVIQATRDELEILWLAPGRSRFVSPREPGERQDGIGVYRALARRTSLSELNFESALILDVADHAAARLLQRAPAADLCAALLAAAAHFMAARDTQTFDHHLRSRTPFYLPIGADRQIAGVGVLACVGVRGEVERTGQIMLFARARTFLDMVTPARAPLPLEASSSSVGVRSGLCSEATIEPRKWPVVRADDRRP